MQCVRSEPAIEPFRDTGRASGPARDADSIQRVRLGGASIPIRPCRVTVVRFEKRSFHSHIIESGEIRVLLVLDAPSLPSPIVGIRF